MLSPKGGGRAYVGYLTSIAFPTLRNLTKSLGPRVGTFAFVVRRNGTKSYCPMCSSVPGHLGIEVTWLKPWTTAVFNRGKQLFLYLYKNSASHYSFSRWVYLIWFDKILGPHSGDFDQKFFWKVKCPTYARDSLLGLNIDRCISLGIEWYNCTYKHNQSRGSCKSS